ncbi:hypothetical protein Pmani_003751 [Petrolisthes manimaculis]|uniref:Uncharacterized protein n=1 Tax=Petrolisthes manimaculis TaxID=1843537 RepID=A0AAE1QFX1_9EUCA|nr:hypothetical protein Pmani_003751 [Petrolisthes manimaculis]
MSSYKITAKDSHYMSEDETEYNDATAHIRSIISYNAITSEDQPFNTVGADRTLQKLRAAASADPAYGRLLESVSSGFPYNLQQSKQLCPGNYLLKTTRQP